jgi:hypothetical protein
MCERIVHLLSTRNLSCGIDLQKRNFPDRQWCLYAMMELDPNSDIFKASCNPKPARTAHNVEIEPIAGLLEGIRNMQISNGAKRKGKQGSTNLILNDEQILEVKIGKRQARIDSQLQSARREQEALETLRQRAATNASNGLGTRESNRLRSLETSYQ